MKRGNLICKTLVSFGAVAFATSCTSTTHAPSVSEGRNPAAASAEQLGKPTLKYYTYRNGTPFAEVISRERWEGRSGGFSAGGRFDYLLKMFYANTKEKSDTGLRHAACFEGAAEDLQDAFFNTSMGIANVTAINVTPSSDGKMARVDFTATLQGRGSKDGTFRIAHCLAGKAPIGLEDRASRFGYKEPSAKTQLAMLNEFWTDSETENRAPAAAARASENGFVVLDDPGAGMTGGLPRFQMRADYERAQSTSMDRPWKGMSIKDEKGALKFALMLQKYFYENMANQDTRNPDMNFVAQKNEKRYWCHMPWLNIGPSGREAIHGLTKERDLAPSPTMSLFRNPGKGSDWGVGYYNAPGCRTIYKVMGSVNQPKANPNFTDTAYEDGTVSAKILFTTADFPEIAGSYQWKANVSGPGSQSRSIKTLRHIQMDIAVKDSSLIGARADMNHWVMLTYYFDPNFDYDREYKTKLGMDNPLKEIAGIPAGLLKMRPMGIQTGMEAPATGDTIIFAGSETNGFQGRLNGPADNPKSSCMSCHGTAGTRVAMSPGFMSNSDYLRHARDAMDFSQQFNLAKENFETSKK